MRARSNCGICGIHGRNARRSALQRVAMPPYAVALDGRCDDHYDEGNGNLCYVKGGVACANALAAEELVGAAWIDFGFCDHATANDILSPIARSASFHNVRALVEAIQALDPSCSSQALATIAAVCIRSHGLLRAGSLELHASEFVANRADALQRLQNSFGGAIFAAVASASTVKLVEYLFRLNAAFVADDAWMQVATEAAGGGIYVSSSFLALINCTIDENSVWPIWAWRRDICERFGARRWGRPRFERLACLAELCERRGRFVR